MVGAVLAQGDDVVVGATEAYIRPLQAACDAIGD